jgi:hypothetical protein
MRRMFALGILAAALVGAPAMAAGPKDCSMGPIWDGPASGFIDNAPFTVDGVAHDMIRLRQEGRQRFNDYHLYLSSKTGQMFDFTVITLDGAKPDGMTMTAGLHGAGSDAAPGSKSLQNWTLTDKARNLKILYYSASDATLQLVFGKGRGKVYPMQIHFCVPSKRTEIAGKFSLNLN